MNPININLSSYWDRINNLTGFYIWNVSNIGYGSIDLKDKSSMADFMIIASGTSSRHIQSLSEQVLDKLKDNGIRNSRIEGKESNEWKLVDGIDLIVHIFHPEKRKFYELEKIWSELIPKEKVMI